MEVDEASEMDSRNENADNNNNTTEKQRNKNSIQ